MRVRLALAGAAALALSLAGFTSAQAAPAFSGPATQPHHNATAGFVRLGGSPGVPAVNPATQTLYVPVQCATDFCSGATRRVVDLVSTATCDKNHVSGCRVIAVAQVGNGPLAVAVDQRTDTVYVMNGTGNTVSVLN